MKSKLVLCSFLFILMAGCTKENKQACSNCSNDTTDAQETLAEPEINTEVIVQPVIEEAATPAIAAKNYAQIKNTYSSLTGISTSNPNVLSEYNAVLMQLPSSSDPESLNGFNQIAQTRLAFAYCNEYMDDNIDQYAELSDEEAIRLLLDNMVDVDIDGNSAHTSLYQNLMDIMNNKDLLLEEGNDEESSKEKSLKLSCTALLASSYVSMI